MQIATQQLHNYVAQELKISPTEVKLMLDSQYKGFTSSEDKTVNVATNLHNNMGDIANTVFNETSDYNDLIKDAGVIKTDNYVNNRDEYSKMYGNLGQEFLNYNYSEYTGTSLNNVAYNQVSASLQNYSPTIQTNTQNFSNLDKSQGAHRQLDQNEIKFLQNENTVNEFAKIKYKTDNPTQEQLQGASHSLTQQAMRQTDKAWSMILGENTDTKAQEFLSKNSPELFKVKSQQEFNDGTTDGTTAISNLSQNEYNNLKTLYQNNVPYVTETNKEGTRFLVVEDKKDSDQSFDNTIESLKNAPSNIVNYVEKNSLSKMINDGIDKVKEIPQGVENVAENTWNYLENISPTTTKERMDELYMQGDAGSKVQANIQTGDAITSLLTVTGVGLSGKAILKNGVNGVDNNLNFNPNNIDSTISDNAFLSKAISREDATKLLEDRYVKQGVTPEQAKHYAQEAIDSFEGQITTRTVLDGDTFIINHTGKDSATGRYVIKKEDANKLPEELRRDLALPYKNKADAQTETTVIEPTEVLEGKVADQSKNREYFPETATGGGQQTFIDPVKTNRDELFEE
jgi:hypothetical protein